MKVSAQLAYTCCSVFSILIEILEYEVASSLCNSEFQKILTLVVCWELERNNNRIPARQHVNQMFVMTERS